MSEFPSQIPEIVVASGGSFQIDSNSRYVFGRDPISSPEFPLRLLSVKAVKFVSGLDDIRQLSRAVLMFGISNGQLWAKNLTSNNAVTIYDYLPDGTWKDSLLKNLDIEPRLISQSAVFDIRTENGTLVRLEPDSTNQERQNPYIENHVFMVKVNP